MDNSTVDTSRDRPQIAGIILAAGTASRMGQAKQLLLFQGKPILAHTVEQALAAGLSPLILVLGHKADKIKEQLARFTLDKAAKVETVFNKSFKSGMASSLATGLEKLKHIPARPVQGALFLLGDQPLVSRKTIRAIQTQALESPGKIIIPTFRGKRGNPVYFDACFFHKLMQLSGDTGGRQMIKKFPQAVSELPVESPGICLDIDTPADYHRLCRLPRDKN